MSVIDMDEIRIPSYTSLIKGFRKGSELPVIDTGDTEINCTALKMKTVACHSSVQSASDIHYTHANGTRI